MYNFLNIFYTFLNVFSGMARNIGMSLIHILNGVLLTIFHWLYVILQFYCLWYQDRFVNFTPIYLNHFFDWHSASYDCSADVAASVSE